MAFIVNASCKTMSNVDPKFSFGVDRKTPDARLVDALVGRIFKDQLESDLTADLMESFCQMFGGSSSLEIPSLVLPFVISAINFHVGIKVIRFCLMKKYGDVSVAGWVAMRKGTNLGP